MLHGRNWLMPRCVSSSPPTHATRLLGQVAKNLRHWDLHLVAFPA